ncbi:MAG: ankyrin repeat domain-containing protein [Gammaproteobacteria bacterium]
MSVETTVDPFKQSLFTIFNQEDFSQKDFLDINAVNAKGMSVLHIAAILDDAPLVKRLVTSGANPMLEDNMHQTPLRKAAQLKATEATKVLVCHALQDHPNPMIHSGMTLFKKKGDGVTIGGFYHDANHQEWLVKEGHYDNPKSVIQEFVAGGLFRAILGDYAPQTELVYDDSHAQLLLGSKLMAGFGQLRDYFPYGKVVESTFNGKPIEGLMDVVSAIVFLNDTDGHRGNVGIVDSESGYHFAKVDHGFSMDFTWQTTALTLDQFRFELSGNYDIENIETLGFHSVYNSISKIAETPFNVFSNIIHEKLEEAKSAMAVLQLKDFNEYYGFDSKGNLDQNIEKYEQKLIADLHNRHENFQAISNFMLFEKSIIDHDLDTVLELMETKGIELEHSFVPFYGVKRDYYWSDHRTTGKELSEKAWPELGTLLNSRDIFSDTVNASNNEYYQYANPIIHDQLGNEWQLFMTALGFH